jgi:hypothetical protein
MFSMKVPECTHYLESRGRYYVHRTKFCIEASYAKHLLHVPAAIRYASSLLTDLFTSLHWLVDAVGIFCVAGLMHWGVMLTCATLLTF